MYRVQVVLVDRELKQVLRVEYETEDGFDIADVLERDVSQAILEHPVEGEDDTENVS